MEWFEFQYGNVDLRDAGAAILANLTIRRMIASERRARADEEK